MISTSIAVVAQEIRNAFASTSLSEIAVYDSLDVPDSAALKECAVQVEMTSGPSWESATYREVDIRYEFRVGDPSSCPGREVSFAFGANDSPQSGSGGGYVMTT